jgi:uncharacterized protein YbdZ (MbtH family)
MANFFDDEATNFFVLINAEGRRSLWPIFTGIRDGWTIVDGKSDRRACLEYIEDCWVDMWPKDLAEAMATDRLSRQ